MSQKIHGFLLGILALLCLCLAAIIQLRYNSILFPAVFSIIGVIFFIIVGWLSNHGIMVSEKKSDNGGSNLGVSGFSFKICTILFLIFYSFSLLSLLQEDYTKNIVYYLCIAACVAILTFEILLVKSEIVQYCIIFKAGLLSINIVFANQLVFTQGISQPDFSLHISLLRDILTSGHISENTFGFYNVFAFHHVFAAEGALLTGFNPQSLYLLFGSLIIAIGILFIYIIGKRFVNWQYGLLAAVIFTCLDFYLMEGEHPEHVAYCFGLALICFTFILFTYKSQKPAFYLLFFCSTIAMVLTHHLSAVIVFVTICSLVLIDFFYMVYSRKYSLPSRYLVVIFSVLLFVTLLLLSKNDPWQYFVYFKPYFTNLYSILNNFIALPTTSVSTVSGTSVPTISGTSVPTISGTSVPTISGTPVSTISQPYVPPTGYDKLPFATLFINTLGSSLLAFASILGFCSIMKKRSWFGEYISLNTIFLSFLLGIGILFPVVVFIPDRMYPALQIFGLVFLGTYGLIWLCNSLRTRSKLPVLIGVCIFVGAMSFFSLASIINGFETSPFADKSVAYPKLYTTSQDVSFGMWRNSFVQNENQTISSVVINNEGILDTSSHSDTAYYYFDYSWEKTGFITSSSGIFGQLSFTHLDENQLRQLDSFTSLYDNGLIRMLAKRSDANT